MEIKRGEYKVRVKELRFTLYKIRKTPLTIIGLIFITLVATVAAFAPWIATQDPLKTDIAHKLEPPSGCHPFGTDQLGRDIFSRVVYGTRISLQAGITIVGIAAVIGTLLGAIAGYVGGWIDEVIMRITDVLLSVPGLVLALAVVAALGPGLTNVVIALSAVWWPWYTRLARGQVLSVKENLYIEAARAVNASNFRIVFRHILPNCISPIVVLATLDLGMAILTAAGLSFIGLGAQPPTPEWGAMLSDARNYLRESWWYPMFPGLAISITVLAFNLVGDGFRDVLDPRFRR
jgi:peptide/nickel transport system permease protein